MPVLLVCNRRPIIEDGEYNIWDNIRCFHFKSQVVSKNMVNENSNSRGIDFSIIRKISNWRSHFIWIFIQYYSELVINLSYYFKLITSTIPKISWVSNLFFYYPENNLETQTLLNKLQIIF